MDNVLWNGLTNTISSLVIGANHNVDVTNIANALTGSVGGAFSITGFATNYDVTVNPLPERPTLYVINNSGNTLTLKHLHSGSTTQNQIYGIGAADTTVNNGQTATLIYDSVSLQWRITSVA